MKSQCQMVVIGLNPDSADLQPKWGHIRVVGMRLYTQN